MIGYVPAGSGEVNPAKQIDKAFLIAEPMRKAAWTKRFAAGWGNVGRWGRPRSASVWAVAGRRPSVCAGIGPRRAHRGRGRVLLGSKTRRDASRPPFQPTRDPSMSPADRDY